MTTLAITRILRLLRTRTGRWILAVVFGISCLIGLGYYIFTPSPAPTTPTPTPTDPITLTLTWDEWGDLQNCIWYAKTKISTTLGYAGQLAPSDVISQSLDTHNRLSALDLKVQNCAFDPYREPPPNLQQNLDQQLGRFDQFAELMLILYETELTQFASDHVAPQPSGPGPKKP